jgi:putative endonuclease
MHTVYALKSVDRNFIYIGMTQDLDHILFRHNNGYEKATKPYLPLQVIHTEAFENRGDARTREVYLKSDAGKVFLKALK